MICYYGLHTCQWVKSAPPFPDVLFIFTTYYNVFINYYKITFSFLSPLKIVEHIYTNRICPYHQEQ